MSSNTTHQQTGSNREKESYGLKSGSLSPLVILLDGLLVGAATARLLRTVSDRLEFDQQRTELFIQSEEKWLHTALGALADTYYRAGFQREFALIGESVQVVGVSEFLAGTLGLVLRTLVITDNPPEYACAVFANSFPGGGQGRAEPLLCGLSWCCNPAGRSGTCDTCSQLSWSCIREKRSFGGRILMILI